MKNTEKACLGCEYLTACLGSWPTKTKIKKCYLCSSIYIVFTRAYKLKPVVTWGKFQSNCWRFDSDLKWACLTCRAKSKQLRVQYENILINTTALDRVAEIFKLDKNKP